MADSKSYTRTRNLFDPTSEKPFKLSRSGVDSFLNCPRCFYLDRRLGIGQPGGYPFNLNIAVDALLKKEFDVHRAAGTPHPLMTKFGIDAIPYAHEMMDKWRANFTGVQFLHEKTNLLLTGAVDDVWVKPDGELIVVDYKATSKAEEVTLDADWQIGYKRQAEFYQWLLCRNGFRVSNTAWFVYCNGKKDRDGFYARLDFDIKLIPYTGDDAWVEKTNVAAHACLKTSSMPARAEDCDFCDYRAAAKKIEL